ncbi:MAG: hypothetical protein UY65_C0007G0041 [Parcubacteria group bacterium GW2011_GWA2_51_12]|nr:MAG: hypothetical protein UY65_C0007G0041 [Parcubacteria group bacterium GW2011_GWA2_51_12]
MLNIPNLPEKEELEYKEKEFFVSLGEQLQASSRYWFLALIILIAVAVPAGFILRGVLSRAFIASYEPPSVNLNPYTPQELQVIKAEVIPLGAGQVSLYGQLLNPNPDISAKEFEYTFVLADSGGQETGRAAGKSYLLAGDSRFLVVPVETSASATVSTRLEISNVDWTRKEPEYDLRFDIVQKNTGFTPEGKFFVEGLLRNLQSVQIKKVDLDFLVFDDRHAEILGVNTGSYTDLQALESRYFRTIFPTTKYFSPESIDVIPKVNLLSPGVIIGTPDKIPAR